MTNVVQQPHIAHDVYAYGMIASSTLYRIQGSFPAAEAYAEIDGADYMTGGEAANSSIVLARLGVRVKLDGNHIGDDPGGRRTRAFLSESGIDTSRLTPTEGYRGAEEVIFAADDTRTIFGTYCRLQEEQAWNMPTGDDIRQAKVVCLDPFFKDASTRAAEIAYDGGIPVVTVDCLLGEPLLGHTSAVVVSESFIREHYAGRQPADLFRDYQSVVDGLVVFTFGDRAVWYARPNESAKELRPPSIVAIDTAGAGDSFRAGVVFGFLQEWSDAETIRFAAAMAALVCTRTPGVINSPNYDEVVDFIAAVEA